MAQSSFTDLREKLAGLAQKFPEQKPLPASSLLHILTPFLFALAKQPGSSLRTQTIHYLMEEWYVKQAKYDTAVLSSYPSSTYPGICFHCFNIHGWNLSLVTDGCSQCKEVGSLSYHFFKDLLHWKYQIHPAQIDREFAELIYRGHLVKNIKRARSRI